MKNLYIYCEGQTEESFINEVLYPYLMNIGIFAKPIVCETKRTVAVKHRGGVKDYKKIKDELTKLCKHHRNEKLSTMFDYYALPGNTPGKKDAQGSLYEKITYIEKAIESDIGVDNLFVYLNVHEFEGLLFTDPSAFHAITDAKTVARLQIDRDTFSSPEHINDSADTAPSKRIDKLIPGYAKVADGTTLSIRIGIDAMMKECRHFREWIGKIKAT
jgi:hypothetical protein